MKSDRFKNYWVEDQYLQAYFRVKLTNGVILHVLAENNASFEDLIREVKQAYGLDVDIEIYEDYLA